MRDVVCLKCGASLGQTRKLKRACVGTAVTDPLAGRASEPAGELEIQSPVHVDVLEPAGEVNSPPGAARPRHNMDEDDGDPFEFLEEEP